MKVNNALDAYPSQRMAGPLFVLLYLLWAPHADASIVPAVTIAQVSSEVALSNSPFNEGAVHAVDGSGLDAVTAKAHSNDSYGTMWLANTFIPSITNGPTDIAPSITFNLGSLQSLTSFKVWNYNGIDSFDSYIGRSIKDVDIAVSDNGTTFTDLGIYVFARAPGASSYTGESVAFDFTTQFVRFNVINNYANDLKYGVGLSEIQFSAVPLPPAIWLFGTGLLGWLGIGRRKQ